MRRRSTAVVGCVRFPVRSKRWRNSREGGMVVKAVVVPKDGDGFRMMPCCGATCCDVLNESLIGDHLRPEDRSFDDALAALNDETTPERAGELIGKADTARKEWELYHFPNIHAPDNHIAKYLSRAYLAVVVLGATGWSGWSDSEGRYWQASEDDLDERGRYLFAGLSALWPGCDVHLLTYLDT